MSIQKCYLENDLNKPIHISEYKEEYKGKIYCCDGHQVVAKKGQKVIHHFAHKKGDEAGDHCSRELGEWHRYMQNRIKDENLEIIMHHDGKKHIADVLTPEGIVVEFQKSIIPPEIILEREAYYKKHMKDIVWVFYLEGHDLDIVDQDCDIIAFKIAKGSKFFLASQEKSFLDQGKRGYIELISKGKNFHIGRLWTWKQFDETYLKSCLKEGADTRYERRGYEFEGKGNVKNMVEKYNGKKSKIEQWKVKNFPLKGNCTK